MSGWTLAGLTTQHSVLGSFNILNRTHTGSQWKLLQFLKHHSLLHVTKQPSKMSSLREFNTLCTAGTNRRCWWKLVEMSIWLPTWKQGLKDRTISFKIFQYVFKRVLVAACQVHKPEWEKNSSHSSDLVTSLCSVK